MNKSVLWHILFFSFLHVFTSSAQEEIVITRETAEAILIKQNLDLLIEELEISKAEVSLIQARLRPNPTFSLDELNLWALPSQIEPLGEELPPIFGNFGKHTQFSFGIEQLIQTARKRKKLMAVEQVTVDKASQYLTDVLRNLKLEFRNLLTNLQFYQLKENLYENQIEKLHRLINAYEKQLDIGSISRSDFIRLKAMSLQFTREVIKIQREKKEIQKELKILMRIPAENDLIITTDDFIIDIEKYKTLDVSTLMEIARETRADIQLAALEESYFKNLHSYEKAQRIPDLNFNIGYDRGGNILYNFIGFGVDIELPLFNKNQGNIKLARIGIEQSQLQRYQKIDIVQNELILAYQALGDAIAFHESIDEDFETTLDELLIRHIDNFENSNISLLEFTDFLQAYIENKEIILEARKDLYKRAEDLNYSIGQDLL